MGMIMKNGVPYAQGSEIPQGGTKGQVLAKASDLDGDMEWKDEEGGGGGGETPTLDAVLKKGNETSRSASFTDSNDRRTDVSYDGAYMTGTGTEGMRQVTYDQNGIRAIDNLVGTITPKFVVPFDPSGADQVAMSDAVKESFKKALDTNAKITFDNEYNYLQIRDGNGTDIGFSQDKANTVRIQEYAKDDRGQVKTIFDEVLVSKTALENAVTESGFFVVDTATTYTYAQLKTIVQTGRVAVTHEGQTNVVISYECVDDNLEGQNYIILTVIKRIYSGGVPPVVLHYEWWGEIGGEFSFTSTRQSRVENVSNSFNGGSPSDLLTKSAISSKLNEKQDVLVSGTSIKTVNGNSLLGQGNLDISGGVNFEVGVEKWYGTYTVDGVTYQVYSKLLDIGPLPSAAGVTNYPHGISGIKQILQINGFTNDGFVMNAPRQVASDNISIYQAQKSGNIAVEVGKDRSNKNGFVMMIYAKNN